MSVLARTEEIGKRACVVGWPIAHSRSPLIHGYWLDRYGISGRYSKEAVAPESAEAFFRSLGQRGYAGCNVTVPHKEIAFQLADIKDQSAIAIGAANTLWLEGERLACANTDSYGFMTNLAVTVPDWTERPGPIMVLGAGGSARAIVYGMQQAGRRDIRIYNRSIDRADALARHFAPGVTAHLWAARHAHVADAAVIINTTTLGMNGAGDPAIDFAAANPRCVVADLVYVPLETAFLRHAKAYDLAIVGGLGMLLHQAVPGFEKWFGVRPEVTDELYRTIVADIEVAR